MQATLGRTLTHRLGLRSTLAADFILIISGSLLISLMAQIRIPLPFSPVPITGQTFAVLLVGAALGGRRAALSMILYLGQGAIGLPVFAGGGFGLARLLGPTGGYLVGFVPAAYLIGWLAEQGLDRRPVSALPIFLAGQLVIYAFGVLWLSAFVGLPAALAGGLWPFLAVDGLKALLAAASLPAAWRFAHVMEDH
jgi:biotin transport system substrate-specific component